MSRYCHHLRSPKYRILSLCFQVLNLLIVLGMISFNNHFLDGKFYELGFAWVGTFFDGQRDSSYAVLYHMFPRMTICEFQSYGSAGNQILKIGQSGLWIFFVIREAGEKASPLPSGPQYHLGEDLHLSLVLVRLSVGPSGFERRHFVVDVHEGPDGQESILVQICQDR